MAETKTSLGDVSLTDLLEQSRERGLIESYEKTGYRYTIVREQVESCMDAISARSFVAALLSLHERANGAASSRPA